MVDRILTPDASLPIVSLEARRTTLAMLQGIGAFETSVDGSWAFVSPGLVELLGGLPASSLLGREWIHRLHPDDRQPVLAGYRQARDLRRAWEQRFRLLRADESPVWVSARAWPIAQAPQAAGVAYVGLLADISDRMREIEVAGEPARLLSEMSDLLSEGVIITRAGRIVGANRAAARMAGFPTPDAMVGTRLEGFLEIDAQSRYDALGSDADSQPSTGRLVRRDTGAVVTLAVNAKDIEYAGGPARMFSCLHIDDPHIRAVLADRNERRLASLEALLPFAYHRVRLDAHAVGAVEYANQRFCDLLGRPPEEVLGLRMNELLHPDDRAPSSETVEALAQGERNLQAVRRRLLRSDGTYVTVDMRPSIYHDPVTGDTMAMVISTPVENPE